MMNVIVFRKLAVLCAAALACTGLSAPASAAQQTHLPAALTAGESSVPDEGVLLCYESGEIPADLVIPAEYNGKPVLGIAEKGFMQKTEIVTLTLPSSVMIIYKDGFCACSKLKKINFSEGLLGIDDNAFQLCTSLESVEIPNTVTNIGNHAFENCVSLQSVKLANSVNVLGEQIFRYCKNLKNVTLSESLQTVPFMAFADCTGLESITLPESVKKVDRMAFANCTALQTVTILNPECEISGRTTISTEADSAANKGYFRGTIRGYVGSTAEAYAKKCNYKFEPLDPENIVTTVPEHVSDGFIYDRDFHGIAIKGYVGELPETLTVPQQIGGVPVGAIFNTPFQNSETLKHLVIPASVTIADLGVMPALESVTFLGADCELALDATTLCNGTDAMDPYYNGVIRGPADSWAKKYADRFGFRFEEIDPTEYIVTETTPAVTTTVTTTVTTSDSIGTVTTTANPVFDKEGLFLYEGVYYKNMGDYVEITGYVNTQMTVKTVLESMVGGLPVMFVGENAFSGLKDVQEITIPASVIAIKDKAFFNCRDLHFVTAYNPTVSFISDPSLFTNDENGGFTGTIISYKDSSLESYANYHQRFFMALDDLKGDVVLDGTVSIDDAQLTLKAYTEQVAGNGMILNGVQFRGADVNGDAKVDVEDAQLILIYYTETAVAGIMITWDDLLKK